MCMLLLCCAVVAVCVQLVDRAIELWRFTPSDLLRSLSDATKEHVQSFRSMVDTIDLRKEAFELKYQYENGGKGQEFIVV